MPRGYTTLKGSRHPHPKPHRKLGPTDASEELTVTLLLRRRPGAGRTLKALADFCRSAGTLHQPPSRTGFANTGGADPKDLKTVAAFARAQGLTVVSSHRARRAVIVRGSVARVNKSFALKLQNYRYPGGDYRSHDGLVSVPRKLAGIIEAVVGLTNRKVPAQHFAAKRAKVAADPPNTQPVTPQQVASLYQFPPGDGAGQTIGLYEMDAGGAAGYSLQDIQDSIQAFGGALKVPTLIDVAIDGVGNSGVSDGETGLDITVAGAIAQGATIAVYFTGGTVQAILHALQRMIHPDPGDPVPTIISISYGWGPDAPAAAAFSMSEYTQLGALFQDAANLAITVLVSSGDTGAFIMNKTQAQVSYPATEPWVTACGGTTVGNILGASFEEFAWNDLSEGGSHSPGATGGGISDRFPVPAYQQNFTLPRNIVSNKAGRGIPDVAGNASENSGYIQYIQGQRGPVGGTSAVAPLYAGLIARINANVGRPAGFINPQIYAVAGGAFRDIAGPAGPMNNSYGRVVGYPVTVGWDGCTGLGSVKGMALQSSLQTAAQGSARRPGAAAALATGVRRPRKVFKSGTFRGVDIHDPFAVAAREQTPVVVDVAPVWPAGLAPTLTTLGGYRAGAVITGPLNVKVDVLIVLYTDQETQALLEVFTGNNSWGPGRQKQWCGYAHNFAKFKSMIGNIGDDGALQRGLFGYLSAVKIGAKTVALYKTELHPKQNGAQLPFVPVMQQLITELAPGLVISTGTAGAIGASLNCGDVVITNSARFHCEHQYPNDPQINLMSQDHAELTNAASVNPKYVDYAIAHLTQLSLAGLGQCRSELTEQSGYGFVRPNLSPPNIYVAGSTDVPGAQSMAVVSADYLTVDDNHDLEGLQALGTMNDTDDAFLFFAISGLSGPKPAWLSIRNASEPQIDAAIPAGTSSAALTSKLAGIAGRIYGIYQYCTTLNSAFACWAVIAGL